MRAPEGRELTDLVDDGQQAADERADIGDVPAVTEITALGNEDRWRARLESPHAEARATIDCPFWWGCDVLASFEPVELAAEAPFEIIVELRGAEQTMTTAVGALSQDSVSHVRAWGHAQSTLEPSRYEMVLRLSPSTAAALEAAGVDELELEAVVAWQSLGAWGASDVCRACETGDGCGAGSSCLARGVCFDGGARAPANGDCVPARADPVVTCGACEPIASDWIDPSIAVRGELEGGSRCWLVHASDDALVLDEQMQIELRIDDESEHENDVYELRLYRDVDACAAQRPVAVAFAHGDAHELRWLETAAPDDGTFVVEVRKRSGAICGGAFSLSVTGLH